MPRSLLALDAPAVIDELRALASKKTKGAELLRIYWYDVTGGKGLSTDQTILASLDDVKLRLALANQSGGPQLAEASMLADLIELARLRSIRDAIIMADGDLLTVGVQIAQNYGVRVHVVEIEENKGSQSTTLVQEADTSAEWTREVLERVLAIRPSATLTATLGPSSAPVSISIAPDVDPVIGRVAAELATSMDGSELEGVNSYIDSLHGVPPEFDGKLLGMCRAEVGRDLTIHERRHARARFFEAVKARANAFK